MGGVAWTGDRRRARMLVLFLHTLLQEKFLHSVTENRKPRTCPAGQVFRAGARVIHRW